MYIMVGTYAGERNIAFGHVGPNYRSAKITNNFFLL